jgi:hypothetical protein
MKPEQQLILSARGMKEVFERETLRLLPHVEMRQSQARSAWGVGRLRRYASN